MPKPWADTPFSLIPTPTTEETKGLSPGVITVATEMALAHNMMVRNLNSIYHQSPHVRTPTDIADFIIYSQVSLHEIHMHHKMEETVLFPSIAAYTGVQDIMAANVAQHQAFEKGLEEFEKYIHDVTPETYDGLKVRDMVKGFGAILAVHLRDEIPTLLGLEKFGGDKLLDVYKKMEKDMFAQLKDEDKVKVLPVGLGAVDITFEGGKYANWPPFPFFVPYLVKYYYARKYKGAWRFCPTTFHGQPRPLLFAVDED